MEAELKCPSCGKFFSSPVILPCHHSLCMACAARLQVCGPTLHERFSRRNSSSGSSAAYSDVDKISLYSEADSGIGSLLSRPCSSYLGAASVASLSNIGTSPVAAPAEVRYSVACPCCRKVALLDDEGCSKLPRNRVIESIIERHHSDKICAASPPCHSCDGPRKAEAVVMCEECEAFYCVDCRDERHTSRGPFAGHTLVSLAEGRHLLRQKAKAKEARCKSHADETLTMYCNMCKCAVCYLCVQQGQHLNHDVQALGSISKLKKAELTQTVQSLSEKAKVGSAFVQQLKAMVEQVEASSIAYEEMVDERCDALLERLERKRRELLQVIARDREQRVAALKEQVIHSAAHFQKTTGLLQFSVEALREQDTVAFMQVCDGLQQRTNIADSNYHKEMEMRPRVSPHFHLALDNRAALHEIDTMNFFQMRVPGPPVFAHEECIAHNNKVTLVWRPLPNCVVEAYVLELDDGAGGSFREVYCGPETVCHIDGLHFDSVYTARVRCYNQQGESAPSECLRLRTSNVAWFNFERERHTDIVLSEDKLTATCSSFDDRVVLGTIGFSRGVHYWECRVDRYDNHPDPAFGVARLNTAKDAQLGKDDLSWSLYADDQRSWFMHAGEHTERTEGGVSKGFVVGIKLDLNVGELHYYINGRRHGPRVAFGGLQGVFFPAISLNRNVQVTLRTGLIAPPHDD